ncbi:hypothetical protein HDU88_007422 [Geranomyces variabilis]|nr:hypothetical protein HDU88_007422 [Geranomyces variabilis]
MSSSIMYTHRTGPDLPLTTITPAQTSSVWPSVLAAPAPPNARSSAARERTTNPPWRSGAGGSGGGGASAINSAAREKELSAPTRGILKSMMHASKLSSSQQRFLDEFLTSGAALPAYPTAGMSFRAMNDKRDNTAGDGMMTMSMMPMPDPVPVRRQRQTMPRNRRPQIRTLAAIASSDAFEADVYRPLPHKDYAVEKLRLQDRMEGVSSTDAGQDSTSSTAGCGRRRRGHEPADEVEEHAEIDEFDMLMEEIADRRQWLDDMVAMGHGDAHKRKIQLEISQRIRRLEALDAERTRASGLARAAK